MYSTLGPELYPCFCRSSREISVFCFFAAGCSCSCSLSLPLLLLASESSDSASSASRTFFLGLGVLGAEQSQAAEGGAAGRQDSSGTAAQQHPGWREDRIARTDTKHTI